MIESADAAHTTLFDYAVANREMVVGPRATTACFPLPVVNIGQTCQYRHAKCAPRDSSYFAEAACDLVEFTLGDAQTTKWGALRAKMGHPAPFKLHFLQLGNEQWGPEYVARAKVVSAALRAR